MTDVLTPEQRSRCMGRIRGSDTGPEIALRRRLWTMGLRYRIGHGLPGKPDIVFPRARIAVFVDGCFWHRCPEHYTPPATNAAFWEAKTTRNVERDREVDCLLTAAGWTLLRYWEHQVRTDADGVAEEIAARVRQSGA